MAERRGKGENSIYFEHTGACRDGARHRNCPGLWREEVCLGYGDWLEGGLPGRSAKTVRKNKDVLEPILAVIGT